MRSPQQSHPGFTLMELIMVIGLISILMVIVYGAINPRKQYEDAENADRTYSIRAIEHSITQYIIDGNNFTGIPNGIGNALPICQDTVTGTDCTVTAGGYDLSILINNGEYAVNIPIDPAQTGSVLSGYYIYMDGSFIRICSPIKDANCG